jgi:hypothetical protein
MEVTAAAFFDWWVEKRGQIGQTPEQRQAWDDFVKAFDKEHGLVTDSIDEIPAHARAQFMAGYALIYG